MKTKIIIAALFYSLSTTAQALLTEESFIAPLAKESLLLAVDIGQNTIIVGERGHILVNDNNTEQNISAFKQVVAPTRATLTDVISINEFAWAVGHDATILKSKDAGLTWSLIQSFPGLDRPLLSVHFFDINEGVAVGAYGLFYRSQDGGDSWQQEQHPSVLSDEDNEYLESIKDDKAFYIEELSFISPHLNQLSYFDGVLYLAGEAGLVAKSEDRGESWLRLDVDYLGSFFDVTRYEDGKAIAAGLRGNIFIIDGDEQRIVATCITTSINALIRTQDKIFALGNNGILLAIELTLLEKNEIKAPNSEGCQADIAVSQIETNFSQAVLAGILTEDGLVTLTAGGLKMVAIEE